MRTLQLNARIDAFLEWKKDHPGIWDDPTVRLSTQAEGTRGLAGVPSKVARKGNRPHRLTELA